MKNKLVGQKTYDKNSRKSKIEMCTRINATRPAKNYANEGQVLARGDVHETRLLQRPPKQNRISLSMWLAGGKQCNHTRPTTAPQFQVWVHEQQRP